MDARQEEKLGKLAEAAARITGWLAGFVLVGAGTVGAGYCLLYWRSFLFGYHYVGLWEWRIVFFFFLILIYAGVTVLRSCWQMRKEDQRRNQS